MRKIEKAFLIIVILLLAIGVVVNVFWIDIKNLVYKGKKQFVPVEKIQTGSVKVHTSKPIFHTGEWIEVAVSVKDFEGKPMEKCKVKVKVKYTGKKNVKIVGHKDEAELVFVKSDKTWQGRLALPLNAPYGKYVVKAKVFPESPAPVLEGQGFFYYEPRTAKKFKKAMNIVVWNTKDVFGDRTFVTPEGKSSGINAVVKWSQFLKANAVFINSAITRTFEKGVSKENPFFRVRTAEANAIAEKLKAKGKKVGFVIDAFHIEGSPEKLGYKMVNDSWISLGDKNRIKDVLRKVSEWNDDWKVDYIGITGIGIPKNGGFELADEFVSETATKVPSNWDSMPLKDKENWLKNTISEDKFTAELWKWWKHQKVAEIVRFIKEKTSKPVFVLIDENFEKLSINPDAVIGAGADGIILVMNGSKKDIKSKVKKWRDNKTFEWCAENLFVGYEMNYSFLEDKKYPALKDFESFNKTILNLITSRVPVRGIAVEGSKLLLGKKGVYVPLEWFISYRNLIDIINDFYGNEELKVNIVPQVEQVQSGVAFETRVIVNNKSSKKLKNITINFLKTPAFRLIQTGGRVKNIDSLDPHKTESRSFVVRIDDVGLSRKFYTIACKVVWTTSSGKKNSIVEYITLPRAE